MVNGNTAPYRELDNIRIVHEQEERYRVDSLVIIEGDETRRSQLYLVELALSLLVYFTHDYEAKTEDDFTIQRLGIRLFNAGSSAVKLGLSGYYQTAFSLARDIMETGFLLDYLRTAPRTSPAGGISLKRSTGRLSGLRSFGSGLKSEIDLGPMVGPPHTRRCLGWLPTPPPEASR